MKGKTLKCVVVGDVAVGKTTLITTHSTGRFPDYVYVSGGFDPPPPVKELFGNRTIDLVLWDTAGQDDYDRLRPLAYLLADVFLICFSVTSPASFERVRRKWQPEVSLHCPNVPTILVGTKIDLRSADDDDDGDDDDGSGDDDDEEEEEEVDGQERTQHVRLEQGRRMAEEIGAFVYVECSAKTQEGLKNVFHEAIRAALDRPQNHNATRKCVLF